VAILSSLESVQAPASLHGAVASMVADASSSPARRRGGNPLRLRLAAAGALAAAALAALALALTANGPRGPRVLQAADAALRPATLPAPAQSANRQGQLTRSVEGIAYPYWQDSLGWRATGARTDRLGGRTITTVFYAPVHGAKAYGQRIGYAIVAGSALPDPGAGSTVNVKGVRFDVLSSDGATVVTWRRAGHTCILVGRGVDSARLMKLATWE
jgi:hypothetical protein